MKVYCATLNSHKLKEFGLAAAQFGLEILTPPGLKEIPPCVEDGATFEENAIKKALWYGAYAPGPLFADDSGLEVDFLGGAPGVFSARFAGPDATDAENNHLLLEKMRDAQQRRARFVCVIALIQAGAQPLTFRGSVEGEILLEAPGANGFGYHPLFYYPPLTRGFGEISADAKLAVSHRGKALSALFEYLAQSMAQHSGGSRTA